MGLSCHHRAGEQWLAAQGPYPCWYLPPTADLHLCLLSKVILTARMTAVGMINFLGKLKSLVLTILRLASAFSDLDRSADGLEREVSVS